MPDTLPNSGNEAPTEADRLRQQIQALQADLAGLRAEPAPIGFRPVPMPYRPKGGPQGGIGRRLALRLYRMVRPVIRPIAWRTRSFMLGPVLQELAELRAQVSGRPHSMTSGPAVGALDPGLSQAMERLLLTLALEERTRPR